MKRPLTTLLGAAALMTGLLSAGSLSAQTLSFVTNAPVPTNIEFYSLVGATEDSNNVSDGTPQTNGPGNDGFTYIANGRAAQGQTFTTANATNVFDVTAIWIRQVGYTNDPQLTYWSFAPGTTFTFRITDPSQVNTAGFVVNSQNYTITGAEPNNPGGFGFSTTGTGLWLRFGFPSNAITILSSNKQYGFDVDTTGGDFFESWGTSNDVYSGGTAYNGTSTAGDDDTLNPLVGDRAFLVEINGGTFNPPQVLPPAITTEPASVMVPMGANAVFAPAYAGTQPFSYQWYYNTSTLLTNQTNATLTVAGATTNEIGAYSVIVTNTAGAATSSVAKLAIVLPSVTTNVNFAAASGSILDVNGAATPFNVRLAGTGASIPTDDPDLLMNVGSLDFTSTTCDFNGQLLLDEADAIGFNLSSIGFDGTQDFTVTGSITNVSASVNYDQSGIFAGGTATNFVRAGLIFNSDFTANPGSYGVGNQNGGDIGIATAPPPPADMLVTIARAGGVWSASVNGVNVTPNASLAYLDTLPDMTVGVFTLDTSGTHNTSTINGFSASLFTGPKVVLTSSGGNLHFAWNVIGAGLQSNPNLNNPAGWTPVAGASASPYSTPLPSTGSMFYRIAP